MEPTAKLVEFVAGLKFEDIPLSSIQAAKREFLDIYELCPPFGPALDRE